MPSSFKRTSCVKYLGINLSLNYVAFPLFLIVLTFVDIDIFFYRKTKQSSQNI